MNEQTGSNRRSLGELASTARSQRAVVLGVSLLIANPAMACEPVVPFMQVMVPALALSGSILVLIVAVVLIGNIIPHPREHALGATAAALFGYVVLHAGIGLLFLLSNFMRLTAGFISPRRLIDLRLTRLWLDYTAVTGTIAISLVLTLPTLVGILGMRP